MKNKGWILITIGVLGVVFILSFDMIMGKPANDISGPKSIIALVVFVFVIIGGIRVLLKGLKNKDCNY